MSRSAEVVRFFGGKERTFVFGLGEHERLQAALNDKMGVSLIVQNLSGFVLGLEVGMSVKEIAAARLLGDVRIEQIREVIFAGLVGSGMEPPEAGKLCDLWVYKRPLKESAPLAYAIGLAAIDGPDDEVAMGEQLGDAAEPPSQTAVSASVKTASGRSARRTGTRRSKSTG
jgi:hypothetical protein